MRISKRTQHFTITKISLLMLFKEIICVYCEKHTKPINTKYNVTDC
jgi:thioredoxin-related protein